MGRQHLELTEEEMNMRKIAFLFAAIAAIAVSCQKEPVNEPVPAKGIEKTFVVSSPETRTVLDGMSVRCEQSLRRRR